MDATKLLNELGEIQRTFDRNFVFQPPRIAGGCLRNLATEREVKDIDVFISNEQSIQGIGLHHAWDLSECKTEGEETSGGAFAPGDRPEGFKVWKGYSSSLDLPIDVILVPPDAMTWIQHRFPDYISEMWLDSKGKVSMSTRAREDLHAQRIRYFGARMSDKRLARLHELYPTWDFVDLEPKFTITHSGRKPPAICPEVWYQGNFNADQAMDAIRALSKGGV